MISLPVLGPNILFPYGLAIGACVAIIALNLICFTIERAASSGKRIPVIIGFYTRIALYGGALYLAATTSIITLAGAAIGLILPHIVLYLSYGLVPAIKKRVKKEPEPVWITDTSSLLFIKEPYFIVSKKGKTYLTHKHYRKTRVFSDGA